MENQILFHLRETCLYRECIDGKDKIIHVNHVSLAIKNGQQHELYTDRGTVYAPIMGNGYSRLFVAVQETPAELSNNPYIKLVEINKEEK